MTTLTVAQSQQQIFLGEVFPLSLAKPTLTCCSIFPDLDRESGNRLSYHLCRAMEEAVAIWQDQKLWILTSTGGTEPDAARCQEALAAVQRDLPDIGDRPLVLQGVERSPATPTVISKLAFQILRTHRAFTPKFVTSVDKLTVIRKVKFWAETVELQEQICPALGLTVRTDITFKGNLADFYASNAALESPESLLIGLPVQDLDLGSGGNIVGVIGTVAEHRERLLKLATGRLTQQAIQQAPNDQLVVGLQFGKGKKVFHYPLSALRPSITAETAGKFGFDYGQCLKFTKIPCQERQELLATFKEQATTALARYSFQIERNLNSWQYPQLFWQPRVAVDQTSLLFGRDVTGIRGRILQGLSQGGVYSRHPHFTPGTIRIAVFKLCDLKVGQFVKSTQERLKRYGFDSELIHHQQVSLEDLDPASARASVEKAMNKLITVPVDIVLTFLPGRDRAADDEDGGSFYHLIYSLLLRRNIASQVIYDDTLKSVNHGQILNQVVPGILAKLGNLPFILAEPLQVADYFIGLDISRSPKVKLAGTLNACASIRLYGKQGEFIRYVLEDALLEGEEIPQRLLERLLPATLEGQTVLIYRDGRFCGQEVPHLLNRAQAIGAKFILVECTKSGVPRLYNLNQKNLKAPTPGLGLILSSREALLVTTQVSERVGLAKPIRLTVHEAGESAPIEQVLDTTLKLTLLHHGALKAPRLPMPIFGADRVAGLRLQGIYPSSLLEGDRQFWL